MSLNLSALAVRERAVTLFFILLLAAAGAYAFVMLGRAEDPNFTIKTLTVTTVWPGATAREMQDLVAEPLEKRLQELTWYDRAETLVFKCPVSELRQTAYANLMRFTFFIPIQLKFSSMPFRIRHTTTQFYRRGPGITNCLMS
jgi:AcrB/AcrD/AcrF family